MKIYAQTLFDSYTISSQNTAGTLNTSGTSSQYDISEVARVWLQVSGSGAMTSTDFSVQFQVSHDLMTTPASASVWINQDSAATFTGGSAFDKHNSVHALKARVQVARNTGAAALTIISVGKPA